MGSRVVYKAEDMAISKKWKELSKLPLDALQYATNSTTPKDPRATARKRPGVPTARNQQYSFSY
jgi:hypothetical protein